MMVEMKNVMIDAGQDLQVEKAGRTTNLIFKGVNYKCLSSDYSILYSVKVTGFLFLFVNILSL